jgi:hypothetical protein
MTPNEYMVWLAAMAVATTTILAFGTLVAADIIQLGRHEPTQRPHRPEEESKQVDLWGMDSFPASDPPQNW